MNLQHVELELDVNRTTVLDLASWNEEESSKTQPQAATPTLNARVVEFIAKPGKVQQLEDCVRGQIMEFLGRQRGFSGAIILKSHQERRAVMVVSFWTTERFATENHWERSRVVRQTAGFLIDVCSRVRTYEAALTNSADKEDENPNLCALWPEVHE